MIKLYGAPASLYTGKVRAYLRKHAIPFEERLATDAHYREVVRPAVNNHRIPAIEFADGVSMQDSTAILDECERRFPAIERPRAALRVVELFLESYAERSLLKAAMHYRWSFPEDNGAFIAGEFGRIAAFAKGPLAWQQAGQPIAERMAAYLPPLGIRPDAVPAIEASYEQLLQHLHAHFTAHPYLLGGLPTRADFGMMGPLYAHLGRDPYPLRLTQQQAPMVFRWVEQMNAPEARGPEHADYPAVIFTPDAVPESLVAVLRHAIVEYLPELRATLEAFEQWIGRHADAAPGSLVSSKGADQPTLGPIEYALGGATIRQMSSGHALWTLQHVLDAFAALPEAERADTRRLFERAGGRDVLDLQLPRRLTRVHSRLALE